MAKVTYSENMEDIQASEIEYLKGLGGVIAELNLVADKTGEFKCTILFYLLKLELLNRKDLDMFNNVEYLWNTKSADYMVNAQGEESVIFKSRNTFPSEFCGFEQGEAPIVNLPHILDDNDIDDQASEIHLSEDVEQENTVVINTSSLEQESSVPILENVVIKEEPDGSSNIFVLDNADNIPVSTNLSSCMNVPVALNHDQTFDKSAVSSIENKIATTQLDSSIKNEIVKISDGVLKMRSNFPKDHRVDTEQASWALTSRAKPPPRQILVKEKNMVPSYPCEVCGKSFMVLHKLKRHQQTHTNERLFACDLCDKRYNDKDNLRAHKKAQHENKKWNCPTCNKGFATEAKMLAHNELHRQMAKLKCQECGKGFRTVKKLKEHKMVHKSKAKHTCEVCGWNYSGRAMLHFHQKQFHPEFWKTKSKELQEQKEKKQVVEGNTSGIAKNVEKSKEEGGDAKSPKEREQPSEIKDPKEGSQSIETATVSTASNPLPDIILKVEPYDHTYEQQSAEEPLADDNTVGLITEDKEISSETTAAILRTLRTRGKRNRPSKFDDFEVEVGREKKRAKVFGDDEEDADDDSQDSNNDITVSDCDSVYNPSNDELSSDESYDTDEENPKKKGIFSTLKLDLNGLPTKNSTETKSDPLHLLKNNSSEIKDNILNDSSDSNSLHMSVCNSAESNNDDLNDINDGFEIIKADEIKPDKGDVVPMEIVQNRTTNNENIVKTTGGKDGIGDLEVMCVNQDKDILEGYIFTCNYCSQEHTLLEDYQKHIKEIHDRNLTIPYFCKKCPANFTAVSGFKRHLWTHEKHRYFCPLCKKTGPEKSDVLKHIRIVHLKQGTKYKCLTCGKILLFKKSLEVHRNMHLGIKPYKCDLCDKQFTCKTSLIYHKNSAKAHKEVPRFQCDECDKIFYKQKRLDKHKRWHSWKNKKNLSADLVYCIENTSIDPLEGYQFKCRMCDKEFDNSEEYVEHMKSVHKVWSAKYLCNTCGKVFDTLSKLKRHLLTHVKSKRFICSICSFGFNEKSDFTKHSRTHTGENMRYYCHFCDKNFTKKHILKAHMYLHTSKKPFECDNCDKSYTTKSGLDFHLSNSCPALHENKNTFICPICPKNFRKEHRLMTHLKTHTDSLDSSPISAENEPGFVSGSHKGYLSSNLQKNVLKHSTNSLQKLGNSPAEHGGHEITSGIENFEKGLSVVNKVINKFNSKESEVAIPTTITRDESWERCYLANEDVQDVDNDDDGDAVNNAGSEEKDCVDQVKMKPDYKESASEVGLPDGVLCFESTNKTTGGKDGLGDIEVICVNQDKNILDGYVFSCGLCEEQHVILEDYIKHMKEKHKTNVNIPYFCNKCQAKFTSFARFKRHLWTHEEPRFFCPLCKRCGPEKCDIVKHIRDVHLKEGKQYKCLTCGKILFSKHSFKDHKNTHLENKPYKCDVCNKQYTCESSLKFHINKFHSKENDFALPAATSKYESQERVCLANEDVNDGVDEDDDTDDVDDVDAVDEDNAVKIKNAGNEDKDCIDDVKMKQENKEGISEGDLLDGVLCFESTNKTTGGKDGLGDIEVICVNQDKNILDGYVFSCGLCKEEHVILEDYNKHMKEKHETNVNIPYFCNKCPVNFNSLTTFKRHLWTHEEPRFFCPLCKRCGPEKCDIVRHIRDVHLKEGKQYKCLTCGKILFSKHSFKDHKNTHLENKPYKCDLCNKQYTCESSLVFHMKSSQAHKGFTGFKCDECERAFIKQKSFDKHKKWHQWKNSKNVSADMVYCVENVTIDPFEGYIFRCRMCDKELANSQEYRSHMKFVHKKQSWPISFPCNRCEKEFAKISKLRRHLRTHGENRRFICSICSRGFNEKCDFTKHTLTHTGENKKYCCPLCGKRFTHERALEGHMYLHTDKKPFPCDNCDKSYTSRSALEFHLKNSCLASVEKKVFTCPICEQWFKKEDNLMTHLKVHTENLDSSLLPAKNETEINFGSYVTSHEENCIIQNNEVKDSTNSNTLHTYTSIAECNDNLVKHSVCSNSVSTTAVLADNAVKDLTDSQMSVNSIESNDHAIINAGHLVFSGSLQQSKISLEDLNVDLTIIKNGAKVTNRIHSEEETFSSPELFSGGPPDETFSEKNHSEDGVNDDSDGNNLEEEEDNLDDYFEDNLDDDFDDSDVDNAEGIGIATDDEFNDEEEGFINDDSIDDMVINDINDTVCNEEVIIDGVFNISDRSMNEGDMDEGILNDGVINDINSAVTNEDVNQKDRRSDKFGSVSLQNVLENVKYVQNIKTTTGGKDGLGDIEVICKNQDKDVLDGYVFSCHYCEDKFALLENYMDHMKFAHARAINVPFYCNKCQCQVKFTSLAKFKRHLWTHEEPRYFCPLCKRSGPEKWDIVRHIRTVHLKQCTKYKCLVCGKILFSKQSLKDHRNTHLERKPYKCNVCNKEYTCESSLMFHMRSSQAHKGFTGMKCDECDRRFTKQKALDKHKKWHKWQNSRKLSADKIHCIENPSVSEDPFVGYKFKCRKCEEEVGDAKEYLSHIINVHKVEKWSITYPCNFCDKVSKDVHKLKRHIRTHWKTKRFICNICSRGFNEKCDFNKHTLIHTGENKKYCCHLCGKRFTQESALKGHMYLHTDKKPFQCQNCSKSYTTKSALELHLKKSCQVTHDENGNFNCPICHKRFLKEHTLMIHLKVHTDNVGADEQSTVQDNLEDDIMSGNVSVTTEGDFMVIKQNLPSAKAKLKPSDYIDEFLNHIYKCLFCTEEFKDRREYEEHVEVVHDQKDDIPYLCSMCPKTYYQFRNIRRHVRASHGPPVEACSMCSRTFQEKGELNRHMKTTHLRKKDYQCDECGKAFFTFGQLKIHKTSHLDDNPVSCKHCDRTFNLKMELLFHMKCHQSSLPLPKCEECDKEFKSEKQLRIHTRKFHKNKLTEEEIELDKQYRCYQCAFCEESFLHKTALLTHMNAKHEHTEEILFPCNHCEKVFGTIGQLKRHVTTHGLGGPESLHHCNECGRAFTDKGNFNKHMLTHSGIKKYQCELCGKHFSTANGLRTHTNTHTNHRPYHCSYCPKSFTNPAGQKLHERIHTGETPYICDICGWQFKDKSHLNRHRKSHIMSDHIRPYRCHTTRCGKNFSTLEQLNKHVINTHAKVEPDQGYY